MPDNTEQEIKLTVTVRAPAGADPDVVLAGVHTVLENGSGVLTGDNDPDWLWELDGVDFAEPEPEPKQGLRAHVDELHPRLNSGVSEAQLARAHGREHFQFGSTTHHHGPNAGPNARPVGWRDGSGVVLIDHRAARLARPGSSD